MHADELRMAVTKIVEVLDKSDIRAVVDQYRSSSGDQRTAAAARLGHAGAVIMERIEAMSPAEKQVVKCLHLETLGAADYWQDLLSNVSEPKQHQAKMVRLASRVMFANSHLPGMISLMTGVEAPVAAQQANNDINDLPELENGEGRLCIRLTDAGERASDPDRVARSIDGVDMLYSACASIARKPAIDLRLDRVSARKNRDRDLQFTGERDSVAAVYAVVDSIPAALADIDPEQDIDLDAVVQSLPIFDDLNTLASLGTFSKKDLKDISDTMHQGALLTLESGVILIDLSATGQNQTASANDPNVQQRTAVSSNVTGNVTSDITNDIDSPTAAAPLTAVQQSTGTESTSAAESDEHYNRYLREREAMLRPQSTAGTSSINGHSGTHVTGHSGALNGSAPATDDQTRRDAVDELLKSLGQSRSS